jgi:tetratricopeptide (TPR) repeat protein
VLAWPDEDAPLDEPRIRARWPRCRDVRPLGEDLYLVSGIESPRPQAEAVPSAQDSPRLPAERSLAAALSADDPRRLATALADLGLVYLLEGDAPRAVVVLEESLAASRQLRDSSLEADALGHLAMAALALRQPARALDLLAPALALARSAGDRHAEKAVLDRIGQTHVLLGDHSSACSHFEQSLSIAADLGDRQHEAHLLWITAIEHAELGRRDRALARAQAAVALLRRLGNPKADWFAHHLTNYRSGDTDAPLAVSVAGAPLTTSYLGGSIDAGILQAQTATAPPPSGPGLLRMAQTAAKSMAGSNNHRTRNTR